MNAAVFSPADHQRDALAGHSRRVVVLPGLCAPLHHKPALATIAGFVRDTRPDALVLLHGPAGMDPAGRGAFGSVVADLRAAYPGMIGVYDCDPPYVAELAAWGVTVLPATMELAPGWQAAQEIPTSTGGATVASAEAAGANLLCGGTGRLRLTGRADPAADGGVRARLVFECGTLAADPAAGTLGFGVLETVGGTTNALPVQVGANGAFTHHGIRYMPPPDQAAGEAAGSSANSTSTVARVSPAM